MWDSKEAPDLVPASKNQQNGQVGQMYLWLLAPGGKDLAQGSRGLALQERTPGGDPPPQQFLRPSRTCQDDTFSQKWRAA